MNFPVLRNESDIRAFEEALPLDERIPRTVYEVFAEQALIAPSGAALSMVLTGAPGEEAAVLSYAQLHAGITQAANLFARLGGAGVGVAYALPSVFETHFVLWGAETAGYAVPLNPLLRVDELIALLQASEAQVFVTCGSDSSPELFGKATEIRRALPHLKVLYVHGKAGATSWEASEEDFRSALDACSSSQLTFEPCLDPNAIVAYFHTGGTTGTPKLVAHTNRNQLTAALAGR
jgi:fatty-acyl-CoA synthase